MIILGQINYAHHQTIKTKVTNFDLGRHCIFKIYPQMHRFVIVAPFKRIIDYHNKANVCVSHIQFAPKLDRCII